MGSFRCPIISMFLFCKGRYSAGLKKKKGNTLLRPTKDDIVI